MVTPANFAPLAATWTAEGAVGATERLREGFGGNPPWHDIRHDRAALVRFTQEAMRVRGSRPTSNSGACESLGGWTWSALSKALRQVGACLANVVGRRLLTYADSACKIRAWYDKNGRWPSKVSDDPIEAKLGAALTYLRRNAPECCIAKGIPLKGDRSAALRRAADKHQFAQLAEVIVMLARHGRATRTQLIGDETGTALNTLLKTAHFRPEKSRGLGYVSDLGQINSIPTANAEIEADCWRFALAGEVTPDPRPWSELLASGDHAKISSSERVAYLDWQDSRLRDGTRWTDPRVGFGPKCPPAVRRPWTPPATPSTPTAPAPAPSSAHPNLSR